jgi:hypothetical protein
MPGPDMRINTRPMGVGPVGPPVLVSGAPVTIPNVPNVIASAPVSTPGQTAAQMVDYNSLRGCAQPSAGCAGCGPEGPSLRDVAPPGYFDKIPTWAKVLAGVTGLGVVVGLIVYFTRR